MRELGLKAGELDLLCGGPLCQSFSQIGKQKGLDDERGLLLFEMVHFARIMKPKAIFIAGEVARLFSGPRLRRVKQVLDLINLGPAIP